MIAVTLFAVTDTPAPPPADTDPDGSPVSRRQSRQDRQARVGILRNPNSPPRPPARRASLMGRWPSLRSSRRQSAEAVAQAAESVVTALGGGQSGPRPAVPVRRSADGSVQAIDIAGLMASVEEIGKPTPGRIGYGADIRPDGSLAPATAPTRRRPSVLTREAWLDLDDETEDEDALGDAFRDSAAAPQSPAAAPGRRLTAAGRAGLWIVGLGTLTALGILIVLPALASL